MSEKLLLSVLSVIRLVHTDARMGVRGRCTRQDFRQVRRPDGTRNYVEFLIPIMAIYKIKQHFPVGRTFLSGMLETGRQECLPYHKRFIKLSMTKIGGSEPNLIY